MLPLLKKDGLVVEMLEETLQLLDQIICMMKMVYFSEFGMDLWRSMSQDLNFNVMFSPRGIINLAHSDAQMNALF